MTTGQLLDKFIQQRDDAAFEALMRFHGPMVFGVCKRILGDHHDAEEAFQATFLVLSRKAASIMPRARIGSWLYAVAYRTALKSRSLRAQRRRREIQDINAAEPEMHSAEKWTELAPLLDDAISALPEKYRVPVVLCDLQGRSHKEVAQELGCPEGTLSSRLMRARNLLAERLGRLGVALSVGSLTVLLTQNAASAAVPNSVILPALKAAQLSVTQLSLSNTAISPQVTELTNSVQNSLFVAGLKPAAGLVGAAVLGLGTMGFLYQAWGVTPPPPPLPPAPQANVQQPREDMTFHYAGTVIDERGNPAAGAKIWMYSWRKFSNYTEPLAIADAQGKFEFSRQSRDFVDETAEARGGDSPPWKHAVILATKEGSGLTATDSVYFETTGRVNAEYSAEQKQQSDEFWDHPTNTLKLVADDVPIQGRLIDWQDAPIAGATVEVFIVYGGVNDTLDTWVARTKGLDANWYSSGQQLRLLYGAFRGFDSLVVPRVQTDRDGRFTLKGVGRERLAFLVARGPGVETVVLYALSRPGEVIRLAGDKHEQDSESQWGIYYPAQFTHKLRPSIPVEGDVTDNKTGRPLANVTVQATRIASYAVGNSYQTRAVHTITDEQGHYRLEGLPMGENFFELTPPPGTDCKDRHLTVNINPNSKPVVKVDTRVLHPPELAVQGQTTSSNPIAATGRRNSFLPVLIIVNAVLLSGVLVYVVIKRRQST